MDKAEYIMINISMIPPKCVDKYNFKEKSHNGYIFTRLTKGVYGLPQAGQIAYDSLVQHLEPYGYRPQARPRYYGHTKVIQLISPW